MDKRTKPGRIEQVHDHRRQWRECRYVYPVIARRARGLSIGVNLNPDKSCTFACVYCQIDRHIRRDLHHVDLSALCDELALALEEAVSGRLWAEERFATTPPAMRRINDIAFSGDGEPTCLENFDQAVRTAADVKRRFGRQDIKLVVITNATQLGSPQFQRALPILDGDNGEIWAKLDAGTEEYFQQVNRPRPAVTLAGIVESIGRVAVGRPVVIQTLFFNLRGAAPRDAEIAAYCGRLADILAGGGRIKLVQIHTIARAPAESFATPLDAAALEAIAARVRSAAPGVPVEVYPG